MNKYDKKQIKVSSAEVFAKKNPQMYWGTSNPTVDDYISGVTSQLELDNSNDIKVLIIDNWNIIGSKTDWINPGLSNNNTESDLFKKPIGFSDSNGAISVRVEFYIRVFTDHVVLWRQNRINLIKGELEDSLVEALSQNFLDYTTLAFRVEN